MWPVTLSGRLPVVGSVGHYPTDYLIGRDPIPRHQSFPTPPCSNVEHPALPPVSRSYSKPQGRSVTHYSPVRRSHPSASTRDPARLACVKHAASARPEPESNSPQKNMKNIFCRKAENRLSTKIMTGQSQTVRTKNHTPKNHQNSSQWHALASKDTIK